MRRGIFERRIIVINPAGDSMERDVTTQEPTGWKQPRTCLPPWGVADLPTPSSLSWRNWRSFIGPGIVMMGVQIGGGEWLFGPEITARFGGGLMWLATLAIVLQVFYNLEVGRYALFCGEPVFTGFLRSRPGPLFWTAFFLLLSLGVVVPGLAFHAASVVAALCLDRPPTAADRSFVLAIAYGCLLIVFVPVLFGGKVYNTLQAIMVVKVFGVLGFCIVVAIMFVGRQNWWDVFSGFVEFGNVPSAAPSGTAPLTNVFASAMSDGRLPTMSWADIAVIGAFVGYAGGGGLANSLYSNFVRDKGWGMGAHVGAIPSAIGGKNIRLSHVGKVFPLTETNLQRWSGWWRVILVDQVFVWAPGCFIGMALPALLSLEFAHHSPLFEPPAVDVAQSAVVSTKLNVEWANAIITADGMRRDPRFAMELASSLWLLTLAVGLLVLIPSQTSIVDEVSRRWTDVIWSANARVRQHLQESQVKYIYYCLTAMYFSWCLVSLYLFGLYGTPRLMTLVIANLGNLALGWTALHLLWINSRWLPEPIRPRWYQRMGLAACGTFYLTLAALVFVEKQLPLIRELIDKGRLS
jgi:hypothetical protein